MRELATSLKSLQTGTRTQNDLQLAFNNSKLLEILGDTLDICLLYIQNFSSIDVDHKRLLLFLKTNFKIEVETLNT